jgi:integrase
LFPEAFRIWIAHRTLDCAQNGTIVLNAGYLSRRTLRDYKACASALGKFFFGLRLSEIHAGHLREYQRSRSVCDQEVAAWKKPCGANRIRKEIDLLIRILRAAKLWGQEQLLNFQPLRPVELDAPRAMQPNEQARFLAIAASCVEWQFIYWYSVLALQTTASTNELRSLRLSDVMLSQGVLQIRREGAKNKYRMRTIPLETPEVIFAVECLIARARSLGASAPHHYLFPIQESKGHYDPLRPMSDSGLKKRWNAVRKAAGLDRLRPYDLRHTAITRMAEAGTPIQVIMSFAGHMTLRMQQHYTAISLMAKRKWATASWGEQSAPGPVGAPFGPHHESNGFPQFYLRQA